MLPSLSARLPPKAARRRRILSYLTGYGLAAFTMLAASTVLAASTASASSDALMQDIQQFLHQRARTLGDDIMIEVRPPSPHLPACVNPEPFLPDADRSPLGRVTVGVRCGSQHRQVRYVQAKVDVIGQYVVAAEDISRGTRLTKGLVRKQSGNLGDLSSRTLITVEEVVGKEARRPIRRGSSFQQQDVRAPLLIRRGDAVTVMAQGKGFRVTREGKAMEDGSQGETIRVRLARREILNARVVGEGRLAIGF